MKPQQTLRIKPTNEIAREFYSNHKQYHEGDSGLDLYILEDVEISLGETKFIDLGIQCEMIENSLYHIRDSSVTTKNVSYYLYPRSSFSKYPLILGNHTGIIDAKYRGNIKAAVKFLPHEEQIKDLINVAFKTASEEDSNKPLSDINKICEKITNKLPKYTIQAGTRLFQICARNLDEFDYKLVDKLSETTRGEGGFGSTGT